MKSVKMLLGIGVLALGVASAASAYKVTLYQSAMVGSTEIKAGEYKVEMDGDKAIFKTAKNVTIEVPAKLESNEKKYQSNLVSMDGNKLTEIDFGGTTSRMVFNK